MIKLPGTLLSGGEWAQRCTRFFAGIACLGLITVNCSPSVESDTFSCARVPSAAGAAPANPESGNVHLIDEIAPLTSDGQVNVVIEIPSGTNAKWEVSKADGALRVDTEAGQPLVIDYLAYPANYGMVPQSHLPEASGGDGDPLDVIVLGPALPRGCVLAVDIIGVLHLVDRGERDDKLIAVYPDSPIGDVATLDELNSQYNGLTEILEIWFTNYKGKEQAYTNGFGSRDDAQAILSDAINAYEKAAKGVR